MGLLSEALDTTAGFRVGSESEEGLVMNAGKENALRGAGRQPPVARESQSTLLMRDFAARLIDHAGGQSTAGIATSPAAFPVCATLRPHLANLMGGTGFRALLLRAVARTGAELPAMRPMQVKEDGYLAWLDGIDPQTGPDAPAEGSVVLVAQLLGLLAAFIGAKLTLQIIADTWPKLPLGDLNLFERDSK
jgi:hypothetical protein